MRVEIYKQHCYTKEHLQQYPENGRCDNVKPIVISNLAMHQEDGNIILAFSSDTHQYLEICPFVSEFNFQNCEEGTNDIPFYIIKFYSVKEYIVDDHSLTTGIKAPYAFIELMLTPETEDEVEFLETNPTVTAHQYKNEFCVILLKHYSYTLNEEVGDLTEEDELQFDIWF